MALQSDVTRHLRAVDERAGELVDGLRQLRGATDRVEGMVDALERERMQAFLEAVSKLQDSIDRIEGRVVEPASREEAITSRLDRLDADLNERMHEVRGEVRAIRPPIDNIAANVRKVDELLPDADAGPLTRLKETLTAG